MSLFTYAVAGGGFILIGTFESLLNQCSAPAHSPKTKSSNIKTRNRYSSSLSSIFISIFSLLFVVNSLISFFDARKSTDGLGSAMQLEVLAVSSLFLLYSILGLLTNFTTSFGFPSTILNLIALFAFVEEFLLFYLRRRDSTGVENRYFDLLLVPILICIFSTLVELRSPNSSHYPKLGRGIGLILQGTWFLQIGLSFFTSMMAHGCSLNDKSRGNYTVRCKGHHEYHRGRAIATLLFNCHLALLVVLIAGIYSFVAKNNGYEGGDFTRYRPLGADVIQLENNAQFTLDDDEDNIGNEITKKMGASVVELVANNHASHDSGQVIWNVESMIFEARNLQFIREKHPG